MVKKTQVKIRIDSDVAEKLKAEAEKQKRSVNNLLEVIIDEYLKKQQEK